MLVVAYEAAVLDDPGEGALHDSAPWQDLEAFGGGVAPDDLQGDVGLVLGPSDQAPRIAAIGESPLHKRVSGAGSLQQALGAIAVLHVGSVDVYGEQPSVSVGQDVTLATPDLLAGVVAARAPLWSAVLMDWLSRMAAEGEG